MLVSRHLLVAAPRPCFRLLAGLLIICVAALLASAEADPVYPEGSGWGLEPPEGFAPAVEFNGFADPQSGGAIVILEIPVPVENRASYVDQMAQSQQWQAQGITISSRAPYERAGLKGWLLRGTRQDGTRTFHFGLLLAASPASVGQLILQVPVGPGSEGKFEQMVASLATLAAREAPSLEEQVAALPFELTELAGMRVTLSTLGNAVGLTAGPEATSDPARQPQLVIAFGPLTEPVAEADRLPVSRAEFDQKHPNAVVESADSLVVGGRPATRILGRWRPSQRAAELLVAQWTIFDRQNVFLAVGKTVPARRDQDMAMFAEVVDGLRSR